MIPSSLATVSPDEVVANSHQKIFSSYNQWSGFRIEHCIHAAMSTSSYNLAHHAVWLNLGSPVPIKWKTQEKWTQGLCESGNIVGLLSSTESDEIQWLSACSSLELYFDTHFIDRLLEKENVRFREQRNVNDPFLKDIALKLYQQAQLGNGLEKMYGESLSVACAIHLATHYPISDKRIFAPKGKLSSRQLGQVIDYVRSGIHAVISLEGLASTIHLSIFHFSRLFKNTLGISPYQFVLQLKIEYAKRLIKQRQPIGDVAHKLGFTDSAHFCNAFKKITGQSPLQFFTL
jgi:AraC family transcriptional regulator